MRQPFLQPRDGPFVTNNAATAVEMRMPDNAGHSCFVETACPRCHGAVQRIPRRFMDIFISRFRMVHRYRCVMMGCDWVGNLPVKADSTLIRGRP